MSSECQTTVADTGPGLFAIPPQPTAVAADGSRAACASEPPPPANLIIGYIDVVNGTSVGGWVWCPQQPDRPFEVDVLVDGVAVAHVLADRLRPDLLRSGTGNGRHGFAVKLDQPIASDERHRVAAYVTADDGTKVGLLMYVRKPAAAAATETSGKGETAKAAATAQPVVASPPWTELLNRQTDLRNTLVRLGADLKRAEAAGGGAVPALAAAVESVREQMQGLQDLVAQQASQLEIISSRLDVAVAALQRDRAGAQAKGEGRALYWVAWVLALFSLVSLSFGVYSMLI